MFILDSLAGYTARDAKDAESIVERVTPRLQHANCAVVLSAVKARAPGGLRAPGGRARPGLASQAMPWRRSGRQGLARARAMPGSLQTRTGVAPQASARRLGGRARACAARRARVRATRRRRTGAQVVLKQMGVIEDEALRKALTKKMAPPLVTLLSGEPEIQYVALRNISLIVQQFPQILSHEVKVRRPARRAPAGLLPAAAACARTGRPRGRRAVTASAPAPRRTEAPADLCSAAICGFC